MELINIDGMWVRKDVPSDLQVFQSVYQNDEYKTRLYDGDRGEELVIDVGAHIGSFARLWHEKNPKAMIVCVELNPKNIPVLIKNVGSFATIIEGAMSYGDQAEFYLDSIVSEEATSAATSVSMAISKKLAKEFLESYPSGRSDYFVLREIESKPITIEGIMKSFGFDSVGVLKLDCEGSEVGILACTPSLKNIKTVFGEWHNHEQWYRLIGSKRMSRFSYGEMCRCDVDDGRVHTGGIFHLENNLFKIGADWGVNPGEFQNALFKTKFAKRKVIDIAVPQGIGDTLWVMTKIPALLKLENASACNLHIAGVSGNDIEKRAIEFVSSFDFVETVGTTHFSLIDTPSLLPNGRWNYAPSQPGWHGFDWMLQANSHLEDGNRLEDWMPHLEIDWNILDRRTVDLKWSSYARRLCDINGDYIVLYAGSSRSNSVENHNRLERWTPEDWERLIRRINHDRAGEKIRFVVVGASYDAGYWRSKIAPLVKDFQVIDLIGLTSTDLLIEVLRLAKGVIAFQSGIGCVSALLNVPTLMWWRHGGDSIYSDRYVSYDERENGAFVPKEMVESGRYIPAIYRPDQWMKTFEWNPENIAHKITTRWLIHAPKNFLITSTQD